MSLTMYQPRISSDVWMDRYSIALNLVVASEIKVKALEEKLSSCKESLATCEATLQRCQTENTKLVLENRELRQRTPESK